MEGSGKKMRAICVMLVIMLGMFSRESEAYRYCYDECLVPCVHDNPRDSGICPLICFGKCIWQPLGSSASVTSLSLNDQQLHNRCTFGCAKTKCANITTSVINIRADEVEGCVNNCSNACIKKH